MTPEVDRLLKTLFDGWYSMVCKGCRTMRYIHQNELED